MEINGREVSDSTSTNHAYKCHLDTLLGLSKDVKEEKLKHTMLYFDEQVGKAESNTIAGAGAYKEKQAAFTAKKGRYVRAPLYVDFFNCNRYFPPDCTVKLTFIRNSEAFCLIQAPANTKKYKLLVKDMFLIVKRIEANPQKWSEHEQLYDKGMSAYLPIVHTTLTHKLITKNTSTIVLDNVVLGEQVPFKIFMCLVEHDSFSGTLAKNPLVYKHHNLKEIEFHINGKSYPATRYDFDWTKGNFLPGYFDLMKGIGAGSDNVSPNVTLDAFKDHAAIFCFDRSPDDCCGVHTHLPLVGQVHAELTFSQELTTPISVIFYAFYQKLLKFSREAKEFPPTVEFVHNI